LIWLLILQDNARRVYDRGCAGNTNFGKIAKIEFAPLLWCIIITMLITYIHSVISGKLSSVCDGNKSLYLIFVGVIFFSASWTAFRAVRTTSWTVFRAVRTTVSWTVFRAAGQQHLDCF
jgi:hypothetical protein